MTKAKQKNKVKQAIIDATIKTFEEMTFMDALHVTDVVKIDDSAIKVSIDLLAPLAAKMIIILTTELQQQIVENIYCDEIDTLGDKLKSDCIEELLNVLAGNFLRKFHGPGKTYKMELPEIVFDPLENNDSNTIRLQFNVEDHITDILFIYL